MKDTAEEANAEFRFCLQGAREVSKGRAVTVQPVPAEPGSFSPIEGPPQCLAWVGMKWFPVLRPTLPGKVCKGAAWYLQTLPGGSQERASLRGSSLVPETFGIPGRASLVQSAGNTVILSEAEKIKY